MCGILYAGLIACLSSTWYESSSVRILLLRYILVLQERTSPSGFSGAFTDSQEVCPVWYMLPYKKTVTACLQWQKTFLLLARFLCFTLFTSSLISPGINIQGKRVLCWRRFVFICKTSLYFPFLFPSLTLTITEPTVPPSSFSEEVSFWSFQFNPHRNPSSFRR